jgi:multiple sugar transport system ATP-binding protein
VHAVRGIDLDIPDGSSPCWSARPAAARAPSAEAIAGLEEADDGTIEIGDEVVNDVRPADRDVAMVFQNYASTRI